MFIFDTDKNQIPWKCFCIVYYRSPRAPALGSHYGCDKVHSSDESDATVPICGILKEDQKDTIL